MSTSALDLKTRTRDFALRVIRLYSSLPKGDAVAQVLGKQMLRSATSVGANYREGCRGRSDAEFVAKLGESLKELEETQYWFELLTGADCVAAPQMTVLADEAGQLTAILTSIVKARRTARSAQTSRIDTAAAATA